MAKRPTGSNTEAFVRCTASHVLPQHEAYLERTEKGTDGHALLCGVINRKPGAAAKLTESMPNLGFKLNEIFDGADHLVAETAYVVDVQKRVSTFIGKEIDRQYEKSLGRPMTDYEIGVSLDTQAVRKGAHMVRDFKFGTYSSWWQLYIQGMAILWLPGQTNALEVDAGFVHIESRDDGDEQWITEDSAMLYLNDLDDRADELMTAFGRARSLQQQLDSGTPASNLKTVEGKWCQYCGAFPHCPSKWKLAKSMLDLDVVGHVAAMTREQCGAAWKKLGEIEKNIVKPTKDALRQRMETEGGFPLENGKFLRVLGMPGRESLDRPSTVALIRQLMNENGATADQIQDTINGLFKTGEGYTQVREVKR